MKVKIYFNNEQDQFETDVKFTSFIRRSVMTALIYENFPYNCEVSVSFVDNERIHELNREYRSKDRETDVLSFPMIDFTNADNERKYGKIISEPVVLGDIVLSLEKTAEQAEEFGHSFEREAAFLCVHSVLHLLGYDHELSEQDDMEMRAKQREIMKKLMR